MATIITKYSDYAIHSIEYFISQIESELEYRDIAGLTNNRIQKVNILKEHPLASLMAASLSDIRNADLIRSNIIPAISVTPGNITEEGFTLGQAFQPEIVDTAFINVLKDFYELTEKEIQNDVLLTKKQIEDIIAEYRRVPANSMRVQRNEYFKNEEINISVWSEIPDIDILLGNVVDSILAAIQVGFAGDNSRLRYFRYRISKGLTNFNFGRILYGSEYSLTFLNSYNNFIVYTDDVLSGHDFTGTFLIPGEETT